MKIKSKVAWALILLFVVILGVIGASIFYISELSGDAKNILKDNYESLEYTKGIIEACDAISTDSTMAFQEIEKNLSSEERNITEAGELELTIQLRKAFEKIRNKGVVRDDVVVLRRLSLALQEINMKAIVIKNQITLDTAHSATTYLLIIGSIIALVAFTFIVNFPGYIANPIMALTNSIKSISNKNYEERLQFNRSDEFGELAEAFNRMAEKLDEYEHSNLASILFEKKRIETIINRMSDPVIGLDEKSMIVFVNDQALSLLNLKSGEMIGRYAPDIALYNDLFSNLVKSSNDPLPATPFIKVVINSKENYFSRENIDINLKATGEKELRSIGKVIMLKNVTPYKELDLAKTNFIATVSHELKTPIASLLMGIKLLQDARVGNLNQEQRDILITLTDETGRLSKISNELLDLAQVETGNIKLNIKVVSPSDITGYAIDAVKFHAGRKRVNINATVPGTLPPIKADLDKTIWVLVNLLTNAIRYSPENGDVDLDCDVINNKVVFNVKDFGPGIEKKYLDRLFEKFFQVPGSSSGSGLGLAISKEFIEAQGGTIWVESEPGKGSVFSFELGIS